MVEGGVMVSDVLGLFYHLERVGGGLIYHSTCVGADEIPRFWRCFHCGYVDITY